VVVYAPRGGGKTFYRRLAAQQIGYQANWPGQRDVIAVEIDDLGEQPVVGQDFSAETLARLVYRSLCTRLGVLETEDGVEQIGSLFQRCDQAVKAAGKSVAYVLVDDMARLLSTQPAEAEHNAQVLAALVDFLRHAASRGGGKSLALRVFLPSVLRKAIDECRPARARWPRQCVITWSADRCQAVVARRLDTCWTNKQPDIEAGLGRFLTTEAQIKFETWLHALPFVSPRCLIRTLDQLARYAYGKGVTTELLDDKIWDEFVQTGLWQSDCQPDPSYPLALRYNMARVRDLLLAAFSMEEFERLFRYASHPELTPILNAFSRRDGLSDAVDKAIDYCQRRDLLRVLLEEVEQQNPRMYARFASDLRE
jgi:hypothetical protein